MNLKERALQFVVWSFAVLIFVLVLWVLPKITLEGFFAAILLGLLSFICSYVLVPIAKIIAKSLNLLDFPDGKIKLHSAATPYLGGLAVYFGWLIPLIITITLVCYAFDTKVIFLLIGCTLLLVVGLIDDVLVLKPSQKFFGQCIAVLFFLYGGFYLHIFVGSYLGIILSGLWILTIINAFNLIDVMDGLASSIAIFSALGFMAIAFYLGQWDILYILGCLVGSLTGFLIFNYPPASIYLGDAGSLFIGGVLGAFPLKLNFAVKSQAGYLAPIIILAIPLLELTSLIIIRAYKKIPFYKGSQDHFSIYLQQHGWSKTTILSYVKIMMIILIAVAFGLVAGMLKLYTTVFLAAIFLFIWFVFLIRGSFLIRKNWQTCLVAFSAFFKK